MLKRLCIGVAFLAVVACGGGGGGGDGGTGGTTGPTGNEPEETQKIVLAAGDIKTVHLNVGDKVDVVAAGARPGFHLVAADGKRCSLDATTIDDGYELKVLATTTGCVFQRSWSNTEIGELDIFVP